MAGVTRRGVLATAGLGTVAIAGVTMNDEYGEYYLYEIDQRAAQAQVLGPGASTTTVLGHAAAPPT